MWKPEVLYPARLLTQAGGCFCTSTILWAGLGRETLAGLPVVVKRRSSTPVNVPAHPA